MLAMSLVEPTFIPLRFPDDDLIPLLKECTAEELDPLVGYIARDGQFSAQLTAFSHPRFWSNYPDHTKYVYEIAAEIQKFGGNTFSNILRRGKGVPYKEIVCDVADRFKVNYNKNREVEFIELQLLLKVMEKAWETMTAKERTEFFPELAQRNTNYSKAFPVAVVQAILLKGGSHSYFWLLRIADAIARLILKRPLEWAASYLLVRGLSITIGPIGWAITGTWAAIDIAGPAYRVTIPCVLHIAMLRQKKLLEDESKAA
jgi:uncharacterized protein YaaW (UPF0174 family)